MERLCGQSIYRQAEPYAAGENVDAEKATEAVREDDDDVRASDDSVA